jgi:hypothetical protein
LSILFPDFLAQPNFGEAASPAAGSELIPPKKKGIRGDKIEHLWVLSLLGGNQQFRSL